MANEATVFEFKKNSREVVRIQFTKYEGTDLISARIFYFDNYADVWKPRTKGISIRRELLPQLKEGIDKAYELWKRLNSKLGSNASGEGKLPDEGDETL
ncbi:MAG: PC4/YdbC family ssDNA-binding protein [Candidatus Aminicenantales bacterium]